ncbi:hypothetical protein SEA_MARSHAWN_56 [Mycobacterium phage Marshawn]|uniref:Uncharacterized protein n=1 Tax=Mycobacterium phage Marshawn TaxID=2652423 RepID=A0A5P8D8S8_9CAUD|nr:hypothetical protein I5H02_gp43 [Mycobacterium phage Marshawn]QFP94842.1 hypothetical protein SEA_MARSHAWN_56 [Mycobacterium phage Marshawn]
MTDSKRPWWADSEAVEAWCDHAEFDTAMAYLDGLAAAIEQRIAYLADDPAVAASSALAALDHATRPPVRFVVESWGGELIHTGRLFAVPEPELMPFQQDDWYERICNG